MPETYTMMYVNYFSVKLDKIKNRESKLVNN